MIHSAILLVGYGAEFLWVGSNGLKLMGIAPSG